MGYVSAQGAISARVSWLRESARSSSSICAFASGVRYCSATSAVSRCPSRPQAQLRGVTTHNRNTDASANRIHLLGHVTRSMMIPFICTLPTLEWCTNVMVRGFGVLFSPKEDLLGGFQFPAQETRMVARTIIALERECPRSEEHTSE